MVIFKAKRWIRNILIENENIGLIKSGDIKSKILFRSKNIICNMTYNTALIMI